MRVVWILGGALPYAKLLEKLLNEGFAAQEYLVRQTDRISDIPEVHLNSSGVFVLVDAFHPDYMGFAGVEALKDLNCQAKCILLGEPAKEQSAVPFADEFFCGYLPSLDRMDFPFLAGLIQHSLHIDEGVQLKKFLAASSKSSVEKISSLNDFLKFEKTLRNFASKFGIDGSKLKKTILALTLQHTKSVDGKIAIQDPFNIYFGIDSQKLILAVPTMSRGHEAKNLHQEYINAVSSLGQSKLPSGSMCPELFHAVQSSETVLLFSGSTKSEEKTADPCFMVTRLNFPSKQDGEANFGYAYCHSQITKTEEHDEAWARLDARGVVAEAVAEEEPQSKEAPKAEAEPKAETEPTQQPEETPAEEETPNSNEEVSLDAILAEPSVTGDPVPTAEEESNSVAKLNELTNGIDDLLHEQAPVSLPKDGDVRDLNIALFELNKVCVALSRDVHVLMKNRREPSTDKELRAVKEKLEANVKRLSNEIQKNLKIIQGKDTEIAELKERVKRLMSQVQSAA